MEKLYNDVWMFCWRGKTDNKSKVFNVLEYKIKNYCPNYHIHGLVQETSNPLVMHWSYVFLSLIHRYKGWCNVQHIDGICYIIIPPPPPPRATKLNGGGGGGGGILDSPFSSTNLSVRPSNSFHWISFSCKMHHLGQDYGWDWIWTSYCI